MSSWDDIVENKLAIWGKSADEVADILGEGWTKSNLKSGNGWKFTKGDKFISYTTGNSHHPNSIYYKIHSSVIGKNKVVGLGYSATKGETSNIYYIGQ